MRDQNQVLSRVEKALGKPAATMFVEEGSDRHLIGTLTLGAVALYVLGKYLDGFIEGLGVNDLGKQHGQKVAAAIRFAADAIKAGGDPPSEPLEAHADALSQVVLALQDQRSNPRALESGSTRLLMVLVEQGIPESESKRISVGMEVAIWTS